MRELVGGLIPRPFAARLPRGSGQPVLVLPGFAASDATMKLMAYRLNRLGYRAETWGLGRNTGNLKRLMPLITERVLALSQKTGQKVMLVGWSLGGTIAREVAREHPAAVARIVTLGSPVVGGAKYTFVAGRYRRQGIDLDKGERLAAEREAGKPLRVPVTALYDKRDAIVNWPACIDRRNPSVEHIEVNCSHLGMGVDRRVFALIAAKLATR
ncbi:MAG: alpha/beta hydrolase [Nevskia sp.]